MVRNETAATREGGDTRQLVDFHCHYTARQQPALAPPTSDATALAHWRLLSARMSDCEGMLAEMIELGVDRRVLSAPPYLVARDIPLPQKAICLMNDHLADTVHSHSENFSGLATIDIFRGEVSAAEVRRATSELGLSGIIVDCMSEGRLLDSPAARPGLEAAAERGIPVLMHPVSLPALNIELPGLGEFAETLARGTTAAASLLALIRSGLLDKLPGLKLVVPWLGGCGLVLASTHEYADRFRADTPETDRWHIYLDTMGFASNSIRYSVDLVGSDHVLVGSDWPIAPQKASRARVEATFSAAEFDSETSRRLSYRNSLALLDPPFVSSAR